MIAAVLLVFIFKFANKDHSVKTHYDERQKAVRGKAYRLAFYTAVFYNAALMCFFMSGIETPLENYVLVFIGVVLACTVLAVYCIWNDVYWGLNNDHRRYHVIFAVALVLNILPVYMNARGGSIMDEGRLGIPMLNVVVIAMVIIIYGVMIAKKIRDNGANGRDDA